MRNAHYSADERITGTMCTIDHIIPLSRRGTNEIGNCVASCQSCNQRRNREEIAARRRARHQEKEALTTPMSACI